jgi:hypothetical protein
VLITVSYNAVDGHGHEGHGGDIIPASGPCPGGTDKTPKPPKD